MSYENKTNEKGERYVWLDPKLIEHLRALRGPGGGLERCDPMACGGGRLGHRRPFWFWRAEVGHALTSGLVPRGPGRDRLAAAAAAAKPPAGLGTVRVSGSRSTLTSAERPQFAQVAVTA